MGNDVEKKNEVKSSLVPVSVYTNDYLIATLEPGEGCINLKLHVNVKDLLEKYGEDLKDISTYLPLGIFTDNDQLVLSLMDKPENVEVEGEVEVGPSKE